MYHHISNFRETTSCWSTDLTGVDVAPFIQPVGPAVNLPQTLVGIFRLFFTTTLVASIVEETNRYAREVLGDNATTWVDVVAEDIWAFLGFALLMGINRLPQLHLYWNTDPVFHYLPIAERISRDRFFCNLEIPPLLQLGCTLTIRKRVICDSCVWRVFLHLIVFPIRFTTSHRPTSEGPASNIGRCGCLPYQLPASSGAGY